MLATSYKKYLGLIATLIIIVLTTWYFIPHQKTPTLSDTTTIKIGYRAHDLYSPLFVGIEKNIFTQNNLKIEPVKFESTNQIVEALLANRIDAALGGVNTFLLFNIEEKSPNYLKIFSLVSEDENNPSAYLIGPYGVTTTIADLNNKKIAAYLGSGVKKMYDQLVRINKLTGTQLIQMEPKLELPALESKQVDAALVLEPFATIGLAKKISRPIESALFHKYFLNDIPLSASVVSQKFITEHPELTKKLIASTNQAIEYINQNPMAAKDMLPKYIPMDDAVAAKVKFVPFQSYDTMNLNKLAELSQVLYSLGETKTLVNTKSMILDTLYAQPNQHQ